MQSTSCSQDGVHRPNETALAEPFDEVYEEHSGRIYYFVLRLVRDPSTAEDITHDVFLKAFQALHTFSGRSSIRTWLYRIALNHCRNVMKSWHQRNVCYDPDAGFDCGGGDTDSPLTVLDHKELGRKIQHTLDQLPEEYRILLLMIADEELSYREIGELTGQGEDAIRGKLYRARKAFARHFKDQG